MSALLAIAEPRRIKASHRRRRRAVSGQSVQRYYDPLGVFVSVDAVTAYDNLVTSFCRYCYAYNNPYSFTDPDGRQSVREMIDSGAEGCGAVSCAG